MNRERMLDLISVLESVPESSFRITGWGYKGACGTVGCAVGHYLFHRPAVMKEIMGFTYAEMDAGDRLDVEVGEMMKHLDISYEEFTSLFYRQSYRDCKIVAPVTKAEVMNRLMAFVTEDEAFEEVEFLEPVLSI